MGGQHGKSSRRHSYGSNTESDADRIPRIGRWTQKEPLVVRPPLESCCVRGRGCGLYTASAVLRQILNDVVILCPYLSTNPAAMPDILETYAFLCACSHHINSSTAWMHTPLSQAYMEGRTGNKFAVRIRCAAQVHARFPASPSQNQMPITDRNLLSPPRPGQPL